MLEKYYFNKSCIAIAISTFLSTSVAYADSLESPHSGIKLSDEISSKYSGKGVKLGVLDGGFVVQHPLNSSKLHPSSFKLTSPDGKVLTYDPSYLQFEVKPVEQNGKKDLTALFETHGLGVSGVISAKASKKDGFKGGVAKDAEIHIATNTPNRSLAELIAEAQQSESEDEGQGDSKNQKPNFDELAKDDLLLTKEKRLSFERLEWATALNKLVERNLFAINNSWNLDPISDNIADFDKLYHSLSTDKQNSLLQAVLNAKRKNTLLVFAAGNESKKQVGVMAMLPRYLPELEKHYLSVVAVDNKNNLAEYSNHCGVSKNWCVAAPGNLAILNAIPDNKLKPQYSLDKEEGTSLATPVVTGALAILKERFNYLVPTQIRDTLLTTATDLGEKGVDDKYGWGVINIAKAINGPSQFLNDETVNVTRDDRWKNDFSSKFKFTKQGEKSLDLAGKNNIARIDVEQGRLNLSGMTQSKQVKNNAHLGVNQTEIRQGYMATENSQLTLLDSNGLIGKDKAIIQLNGSLKIADKLTENSKQGSISATVVKLHDKASYQGGFTKLIDNKNLANKGLMQDLYFKQSEIIAKVNSNKAFTDPNASDNAKSGLSLLNQLRTSSFAYRQGVYNDWLQSALEQKKLGQLHYAVSNHIYADALALLRHQNAKQLSHVQHNLFTAAYSPQKTSVWLEHSGQKHSKVAIKQNSSTLGLSHKFNDNALLSATLMRKNHHMDKDFAHAALKQTSLNIGLRYPLADHWFSELALQFGQQKYNQRRWYKKSQLGQAQNKGHHMGGEIRVGYQFMPQTWIIEPSLGVQFIQTRMKALNEKGELAINTTALHYNDINLTPSVKLKYTVKFEQGSISPYVGLNYLHRVKGKESKITSQLNGYPLQSYVTQKRNHALNLEAGMQFQYKNWFVSANVDYDRIKSTNAFGWKTNIGLTF
ncbi:S8 family serine peptidase [Actinobacillus pleuropneumoniae]|uniref:S8 family serine peptidase n=1 Tax=Actinobacillus pleuropneumoniae TaxID=715 RepID=UPI003B028609